MDDEAREAFDRGVWSIESISLCFSSNLYIQEIIEAHYGS